MVQKCTKTGLLLVQKWTTIGLELNQKWTKIGQDRDKKMDYNWIKNGLNLGYIMVHMNKKWARTVIKVYQRTFGYWTKIELKINKKKLKQCGQMWGLMTQEKHKGLIYPSTVETRFGKGSADLLN